MELPSNSPKAADKHIEDSFGFPPETYKRIQDSVGSSSGLPVVWQPRQRKSLSCEDEVHHLEHHLSTLRGRRKGSHSVSKRLVKSSILHRRLNQCLKDRQALGMENAKLEKEMEALYLRHKEKEIKYSLLEDRITELDDHLASLQSDNKSMMANLQRAREEAKALSKMKISLLGRLYGEKDNRGSKSNPSTSAS